MARSRSGRPEPDLRTCALQAPDEEAVELIGEDMMRNAPGVLAVIGNFFLRKMNESDRKRQVLSWHENTGKGIIATEQSVVPDLPQDHLICRKGVIPPLKPVVTE